MDKEYHVPSVAWVNDRFWEDDGGINKGLSQRDVKGFTKDCLIFKSWFASKWSAETVMDVVEYIIGMIKTNKKELFNNII